MSVASPDAVGLAVPSTAIHPLDRVVLGSAGRGVKTRWQKSRIRREHPELLVQVLSSSSCSSSGNSSTRAGIEEAVVIVIGVNTRRQFRRGLLLGTRTRTSNMHLRHRAREVLGDLDLDVAEIPLPCGPVALLLVRVVGLGRPRGPALQPAVPVVRDEGFALVALRGAVRVDVVDVREVGLESTVEVLCERFCFCFLEDR